jgi:hypothetical protein
MDPEKRKQIKDEIYRLIEQLNELDDEEPVNRGYFKAETLWDRLMEEGRDDIISKLHEVEIGTGGYGTIVVPPEGFSEDDTTHNMVLDFLQAHGTNILNPGLMITRMERALHPLKE